MMTDFGVGVDIVMVIKEQSGKSARRYAMAAVNEAGTGILDGPLK